jgi:hypothetical protein
VGRSCEAASVTKALASGFDGDLQRVRGPLAYAVSARHFTTFTF